MVYLDYSATTPVDSAVIRTFFKACKEYKKRGYDKHIFINSFPHIILSGEDFNLFMNKHYDLMEKMVIEILERPDIDLKVQRDKIYISKKHNFLLAMDDFGSRNNDFNDIYVIQPDIIKIDRGLVTDITNNKENQEVVQRLFDICSEKGIKLLAEGIETKEEYDYFVNLGVDYAQGYYISKPA